MSQQPVTEAINAAKGRWPHILPALGITVPANGKHGPCPKCGGTDRFRFDDRDGRGTWICSHCQHGDGLDLVKLVAGIDAASAAKEVAQALALSTVQQSPLLPARKEASDEQKLAKVQKSYQALISRSSTGESPYLTDKGLQGQTVTLIGQTASYGGVEFPVGALLLPLTDVLGQLRGAQLIHPLGEKRLLPHSLLAGAFVAVNEPGEEPPEQVIITEGYATALTVARLTEGVIVAAVAASNLVNVAQQLRKKWPEARLIVAGDNDFDDGKENTGKLWAERAAKAVDGWVTCDEDGSNYGRLLEWEDTNGISRKWAMPMEMLCGGGEELRRVLLVNGLSYININGQARAHLMEYISLCKPERKVTCVTKTGWHGSVYVLQDEVIGIGAESVILQTSSVQGRDFRQSGTLEEWREQIGRYCVGNGRVAFAVSLAFAAPLLKLVGVGGGGYHLKGESTDGKTTTMKVAASVCGGTDFWHTWRATGNALEGTASRRNDATLMLDEIREVDGREAGNIAYMLANGQGKARARTDGSVRETNRWCLLFLSTGELSLVEHAANVGERTYAGVEVRMIQIPSDTGKYGVFEELHGFAGGKALAEHLEQAVTTSHGAPFREWLRCLTADLPGMTHKAKALLKEYTRLLTPEDAGNQVGRAVTRFALVAMAGELATEAGITGWAQGEALNAAKSCLAAWMYDRGHTANQEDAAALEQVRDFMTRNQFSRFADWYDAQSRPGNMVGFRQVKKGDNLEDAVTTFYVLPSGWKEICKGFDAKKVARLCATAGYLDVPEDETRTQKNIRLPEMGLKRVYQFNSSVLG
ncbi:DUF927 domain-containing protein [Serratia bockelmannii]|uniref:DUF927 domain-containing protein n=1 Tax=Serratia bockelmannii TaxID=2703793 RepID=UPI003FA68BEE